MCVFGHFCIEEQNQCLLAYGSVTGSHGITMNIEKPYLNNCHEIEYSWNETQQRWDSIWSQATKNQLNY